MTQALEEMKKAQWDPHRWAEAIQNGYPPPKPYAYEGTPNYKAQVLMWQAAHALPAPTPEPSHLGQAQSVLILADNPWPALDSPPHYQFWVTADREYQTSIDGFIAAAKKQKRRIRAWCDCHTTFPPAAKRMVESYNLDGWAGEGESSQAFQVAYEAGAQVAVVNMSALTEAQCDLISTGLIVVTAELYRNKQPNMVPDWRGAQNGVGSNCGATYQSDKEGAVAKDFSDYQDVMASTMSWYCGGNPKPNFRSLP